MKVIGYTIAFLLLAILVFVCWMIGRCVRWMRRVYWRHE